MKFILSFLLVMGLHAEKIELVYPADRLAFDWYWMGNENELYLRIDIEKGLEFENLYTVQSSEKGQTCELTCKPLDAYSLITAEGYELKQVRIVVTLENTDCVRELFYQIKASHIFWKEDEANKRATIIGEYEHQDLLLNPTIDVILDPLFYSFIENATSGVIRFTNLFRDN